MIRVDGRATDAMREVKIEINPLRHADGSVIIETGQTKVLCAATLQDRVPSHRLGTGKGWLTAEYAMLPCCSPQRIMRDGVRGKIGGRSQEIQRLIGRALRSIIKLDKLGERQIIIDCDVIEADGGTRTASITGGFTALALAIRKLRGEQKIGKGLLTDFLSAISVGVVEGVPALDLCYLEDSQADTDMNVVMTGSGDFIELQGTAEGAPFSADELNTMVELGRKGCGELVALQKRALAIDSLEDLEA